MFLDEARTTFNLSEFKQLDSIQDRLLYAGKHLNMLGAGSSRVAFYLNNRSVLKIAKNDKGIDQNISEIELGTIGLDHLTKVFAYDEQEGHWLISEVVRELKSADEFEKLTGMPISVFSKALEFKDDIAHRNAYELRIKELENYIKDLEANRNVNMDAKAANIRRYKSSIEQYKNVLFAANEPLVLELQELMKTRGLAIGDLWVYDHYGKTADGRVVLLDYGLTDEVWDMHYASRR